MTESGSICCQAWLIRTSTKTNEAMLPIYLDNGITTVVNMNGSPPVLALRDKIRKGFVTGPNLYTTGPLLAGEGVMWRNKVVIKTPEDARRTVKEQVQAGYDFLKIYEGLSKENYEEIARTAHALGGRMIGHVPDDVGLEGVYEPTKKLSTTWEV